MINFAEDKNFASKETVETIFLLLQIKNPSQSQLDEKTGQPVREIIRRAAVSRFFAEKTLVKALIKSERGAEDLLSIPGRAIHSLALALRGEEDPKPEEWDVPTSLIWREALYTFFRLGGTGAEALLRAVARRFPEVSGNVDALRAAFSRMAEIDALMAGGQPVEAYVAARDAVEAGSTLCASRYLRLLAAFCTEPEQVAARVATLGSGCSPQFLAALECVSERQTFASELPACYAALPWVPDAGPDGMTLWEALKVTPGRAKDIRPQVISDAFPGGKFEPAALDGIEDTAGPVLVLHRAITIPDLWFDLVADLVGGTGPDALPVLVETRAHWRTGFERLIGFDSTPAGVLVRNAAAARALLATVGDNPDSICRKLAEESAPLRLFGIAAAEDLAETFAPASIIIAAPGTKPEAAPGRLVLELAGTGSDVASALEEMLEQPVIECDTPVVLLRPDIPYPDAYPSRMIDHYAARGWSLPIAVRGLSIDAGNGRVAFQRATESGFHRVAPLGLVCLGLSDAIAALRASGTRPAEDCLAGFDFGALAWDAGIDHLGGGRDRILLGADADPALGQMIHNANARPLSDALMAKELQSGRPLPPAHASYLRALETARTSARALCSEADPLPAFEAFLDSGAQLLLEDGRAEEVRDALLDFAHRLPGVVEAATPALVRFLNLVIDCGVQDRYGPIVAAVFPRLAAQSHRLIPPATQIMASGASKAMLATALTTAFLYATRRRGRRGRHLVHLAQAMAAHTDNDTLLFSLRLCGLSGAPDLGGVREALRPFARRLLIDQALPPEEFEGWVDIALLKGTVAPKDWLVRTLRTGDRMGAIQALREMVSHHARLPDLFETLRSMPTEAAALGITAHDWYYPAHLGPQEILLVAALLRDRATLASHLDHAPNAEVRAVAASALGDFGPLTALYAGWAMAEGLSPLHFAGHDVRDLFSGLVAADPARTGTITGPLVSVLMSTFNVDLDLMELSLASLRAQSWAELEIIVVDDGSTAETRAAIERIAARDLRIRFIGLPRNQGPYIGRNIGIANARGEYIAIQDADDVSHPERISHQVAFLEAHSGVLATASQHLRIDEGARLQFQPGFGALADGTMSTLYRRTVFERIGLFAPVRSRGDVEFRVRIQQALGPAAYRETHCPLVFCLADSGTLSQATRRDKAAALQVFRSNFSRRRWTGLDTSNPRPVGSLSVPEQLQP